MSASPHTQSGKTRRMRKMLVDRGIDLVLLVFSLLMLLPLVFLVSNGFKTPQEMLAWPPTIIPANPTIDNFAAVLQDNRAAVIVGEALVLLQRGSKHHPLNALIHLRLAGVLDALATGNPVGVGEPARVQAVDLGSVDGVPLCFTDGAALGDGRIVFTAVAENAEDTYSDGPCSAAAVGMIGVDGELQWLEPLQPAHKVEVEAS